MTRFKLVLAALVISVLAGPAIADPDKDESGKGREKEYSDKEWTEKRDSGEDRWRDRDRGSYFHDHGYTRLNIPPGHYPPPGECRVWYPDRPPGHQPPPGNCRSVPPGAWVIRHPHDTADRVLIDVYEHRAGYGPSVYVTGEFEIADGSFVRVVLER